jgi:class 3 adenylate cyclase/tetratricopeptide (TPR) repeat protein
VALCPQCGEDNPERARFCLECGAPLGGPGPDEERKLATVVFADLVGSTALASAEDPERTRALLDRFYDAMAAEVEGAGGTVEKFVGDAVMAAFGVPAAQEDHAERALHATLSMRRRLEELFGDRLALRIGVNTGEVVFGRAREGGSFVTGDPVNVGARLEQAAEPGEILVGERTVAAARGAFEFGPPTTVEAKGKEAGVACRRLVRSLGLMRPRGVGGLARAFVGREHELAELRTAYRRVAENREPHFVVVVGDAGVGKTTLVRELWHWLAGESPEPVRATGRCLSYGRGTTYWPLAEIVREHFGLLENDPPATVLDRLGRHRFLAVTLGLEVAGGLHPLAARDRLHDAWVEFFEELATERPAVVLIEDLHWAEDELLDLLGTLFRQITGPLLLVGTGRPEFAADHPAVGGGRRAGTQLWLEPLPPTESEQMLETMLAEELPSSLRDLVVQAAEGNPFFIEELVATFIDQGVLQRSNSGWSVGDLPQGFRVPDSVQAVLAARIDLLPAAEKAALQAAAVIGRAFWSGPVYALLEGVEPDFAVLEEREFIRRRAGSSLAGEREYVIRHALTREVAYESLPKASRARLHAAFAAWLESAYEARDEHAPLLGHHYAEAVRPEHLDLAWPAGSEEVERLKGKAVGWLGRAADLAIARYEIDEGLALLERALELEEDEHTRAHLWRAVGRAHALKFNGEAFWTATQQAIETTRDPGELADLYSQLAFETATRAGMWRSRPDKELVARWIERTLELSGADSPARARGLIARAFWDPARAPEAAREASELTAKLGDPDLRSMAWDAERTVAFRAGDYEQAQVCVERRFELAEQISDPGHLADMHETAVMIALAQGRFEEAREFSDEDQKIAARLTPHHRVHAVTYRLEIDTRAGEWEAVVLLASRAESLVDANLATPCVLNARALLVCAVASAYLGNESESSRLEKKALEFGIEGYGPIIVEPRLRLALLRGDRAAVLRLLGGLVGTEGHSWHFLGAMATRLDALFELGESERIEVEAAPLLHQDTYLEPFALRSLGLVRRDRASVERAAARFDEMGAPFHAAQTRQLLDVPVAR